ncbi:MAG: zinc ribbon domain-containing protein [Bryobacteraceae bacterium]
MPVRNDTSTRFMDEVRIIPPVAWLIAVLSFLALPTIMAFIVGHDPKHPPLAIFVSATLIPATLLACYILLIGYVSKDAGRRGMSRVLWTLIAILIPNALGIVLYFVLRKPRLLRCPHCREVVDPGFGFCPVCRYQLSPACPQCQRGVRPSDRYCPYCGADLRSPAQAAPMAG